MGCVGYKECSAVTCEGLQDALDYCIKVAIKPTPSLKLQTNAWSLAIPKNIQETSIDLRNFDINPASKLNKVNFFVYFFYSYS